MEKLVFSAPEGVQLAKRFFNAGRGEGKHTLTIDKNSVIQWREIQGEGLYPYLQGFSVPKLIGCGVPVLTLSDDGVCEILGEWNGTINIKEVDKVNPETKEPYKSKAYSISK